MNILFGGISVILIAQLPPVGDRPLFAPEGEGHTMYHLFTTVVILDQVIRQGETSTESKQFREILLRLGNGQSSEADWTTLLQHTPATANNTNAFTDAICLFYPVFSKSGKASDDF